MSVSTSNSLRSGDGKCSARDDSFISANKHKARLVVKHTSGMPQNQSKRAVPGDPAHPSSIPANSRPSKRPKKSASPLLISKPTAPLHDARPSPINSSGSGSDDVQAGVETRLRGFSPGSDSSDDGSDDDRIGEDGIDVSRLPTVAKDDLSVRRKLARAQQHHACILHSDLGFIY